MRLSSTAGFSFTTTSINTSKHRITRLPSSTTSRATSPARMFSLTAHRQNQPKTFSNQARLPRLPVPDLHKSLEGYTKSLLPLLEQHHSASSLKSEIDKRQLYIKDFTSPGGLGLTLQERLKDLDHVSPHNWLDDTLWLPLAYHTWRAPLLINSNWWLMFAEDPGNSTPPAYSANTGGEVVSSASNEGKLNPNPGEAIKAGTQGGGSDWLANHKAQDLYPTVTYEKATKPAEISSWQIRRAAWLIHRFAEFRTKLLREEILPDSSRAGPFCMSQYEKLYNISRIPFPNSDAFSVSAPKALHMTLLIDDFIYSVNVFAPPKDEGEISEPLEVTVIEANIKAVVEDAKRRKAAGEVAPRIGQLTADERDTWTKNREHLLLQSPKNRESLNEISTSLLALSLDSYTLPSLPTNDPLKLPAIDASIRNCASGIHGGRNRWFDKALSVMVETSGRAGMMGEHSPVDALIPSIIVDYVLGVPVDSSAFGGNGSPTVGSQSAWKRIDWVVDQQLKDEIENCQGRNQKLIDDSDASQLWWNEYGAEWIKKVAKQSPDAYLQQALQLAWYKDQGYATATYETASTRMMLHGRTDVIRSLSSESREFVKGMLNPELDDNKRYELLTKAIQAHNTLTKTSSAGHGFDRHLMGLKTRLQPGETHPIFEDDMYAKSQEWKLSTSGLSAGGRFTGTGFGAAWPDGYGINYLAGPYLVKFGIESKTSCAVTSTSKFKHHIVQSLRDMRRVCEAAAGGDETLPKAKL